MTLTEFLQTRIAEDRERAKTPLGAGTFWQQINPARVLAECEAKACIVRMHSDGITATGRYDAACHVDGYGLPSPDDCHTLRLLAAVYAYHADYRDEWKP